MARLASFMELIDIRAQYVVDDYLNSLIVSGDHHLRDLGGFEFILTENVTGSYFAARCRKNEKYSDVTEAELLPLFDNDEHQHMAELFRECVRDVLNIEPNPDVEHLSEAPIG